MRPRALSPRPLLVSLECLLLRRQKGGFGGLASRGTSSIRRQDYKAPSQRSGRRRNDGVRVQGDRYTHADDRYITLLPFLSLCTQSRPAPPWISRVPQFCLGGPSFLLPVGGSASPTAQSWCTSGRYQSALRQDGCAQTVLRWPSSVLVGGPAAGAACREGVGGPARLASR